MLPKVRALNDYWSCPRCNLPNSINPVSRTPCEIMGMCTSCGTKVNIFVPLQQEGPYRADGIMNDQIAEELNEIPWWDFICPLCLTHNRSTPPPHKLGQPKEYDKIMSCNGCYRNIRIKGRN